jgi:hypothetical protein
MHMTDWTLRSQACHHVAALCGDVTCVLFGLPAVLKTIIEVFFETSTPATILQVGG